MKRRERDSNPRYPRVYCISSAAHSTRLCHLSEFKKQIQREIIMPLTKIQREEFEEYMETILDLYSEDEYESDVENIVYHYCKRKYDIEREESVKIFYEIVQSKK